MTGQGTTINDQGRLCLGGADTTELAAQFGTPLYVMDEASIRKNCRAFTGSLQEHYGENGMVAYASKAFSCKEIYRIVASEGLGVDVVSGGELYTALEAEFPADKILFHGNNKTESELRYAVQSGVYAVVVDNLPELTRLGEILQESEKKQNILLRVKPGVDAHTHNFVRTGQIDSKFGFALETGEALAAARAAAALPGVTLLGIHCHIGSQIFDTEPFCHAAQVMVSFMGSVKKECGITLSVLNLGGGFGIQYTEEQDPAPFTSYMKDVKQALAEACLQEEVPLPFVILEPGRSIVGGAGVTLYTVGSVKDIPKIRTYVAVDGGMTDNPRYALYQAEYDAVIANRANGPKTRHVTIAGRCCESGDLLAEDVYLQDCQPGDILAVLCTGAYNYSMASHYNRVPNAAVVMVKGGAAREVVRRESYEDLVKNDL